MDPAAAGAGMFAPENRERLEASFREFASRPENRPLVEQQQRLEVGGALALRDAQLEARLRSAVLALPPAEQRRLAPVLRHGVLRRLLQSLAGGGGGGCGPAGVGDGGAAASAFVSPLAPWVDNARVMGMLSEAARALRRGAVSEAELEELLVAQLRVGGGGGGGGSSGLPAAASGARQGAAALQQQASPPAPNQVVLPSNLLVDALNEHLSERRAGSAALAASDPAAALRHFARASAIVSFVRGATPDDDAEVARCRAGVALSEAAARAALQEWGAAAAACSDGLAALRGGCGALPAAPLASARSPTAAEAGPGSAPRGASDGTRPASSLDPDLEVRLLLRRAEARLARDDHRAALADVEAAEAMDPWADGAAALRARSRDAARREARGGGEDARRLAARMLRGLTVRD
ncbi:hypothetical protein Rsub_08728 [Raphidocelis subcapitata]|uniref:Uncharacterized protein n=1 Tax=Raphidocelis subcapitata TaxID=307507 RepID=A0A2V0PE63_9CHLO|nr:hypothetical protein Rsub_08728 [Raphidocelis subcapitata]|eukprot:GBF96183.1 hypothetical protein Rsub_08728 [Raphidocelis subcapitata]